MAKKKNAKKNAQKAVAASPLSIADSINTEVIAEALNSVNHPAVVPVLFKVCRLCEGKDGPFLNIFDSDKVTAKKIEVVMPFGIAENDDLPHKICFRCSAKLEELYEFIQKCIRTQESLRKAVGKKGPLAMKTKTRALWEEKLNQSNISNDDICDALIKKAMEGIKDIPLKSLPMEDEDLPLIRKNSKKNSKQSEDKYSKKESIEKEENDAPPKNTMMEVDNEYPKISVSTRSHRSSIGSAKETETKLSQQEVKIVDKKPKINHSDYNVSDSKVESDSDNEQIKPSPKNKPVAQTNTFSINENSNPEPKPFNIMDHVSMIKVNGVGVLFQCKLCNRNFLKKEVVMSHGCAKNGASKVEAPKTIVQPDPPKVSTVKYINTKTDDPKKPITMDDKPINLDDDEEDNHPLVKKPKPRIGPASKVRRSENSDVNNKSSSVIPEETFQIPVRVKENSNVQSPVIQFPTLPSLNGRYKLVAGPNNTFSLVEETAAIPEASHTSATDVNTNQAEKKISSKGRPASKKPNTSSKANEIPVENPLPESQNRPYPVGLFKTVPHSSSAIGPQPAPFTTPAMKKQSYTVVQTGNPSKLLISTKPQASVEEVPKKRQRKSKHEIREDVNKQPFSVTLEDTTPPKDPGFFTFINVDPLLQPSYVLPTDNIIQESQISTSTNMPKQVVDDKNKMYTCNMCNEKFSREKKLLAHIHSHYNKMDEEDQKRTTSCSKKRTRRSQL